MTSPCGYVETARGWGGSVLQAADSSNNAALAAIRKAGPADSAPDELSWRNIPRMKSQPAPKSTATGQHYTGHNGEVFTH